MNFAARADQRKGKKAKSGHVLGPYYRTKKVVVHNGDSDICGK